MNFLRQAIAAFALTLVLTFSAFAGEMGAPVAPPPPTDGTSTSATGDMNTSITGEMGAPLTEVSVTEAALSMLQSATALF